MSQKKDCIVEAVESEPAKLDSGEYVLVMLGVGVGREVLHRAMSNSKDIALMELRRIL